MENGPLPEKTDKPLEKVKNTTGNMERKAPVKLRMAPPPPVRQTLTSYKRMLKANPLLKYQEAGIDIEAVFRSREISLKVGIDSEIGDFKTSCIMDGRPSLRDFKQPERKPVVRTQSLKLPKCNGLNVPKKTAIISGNKPLINSYNRITKSNNLDGINKNTERRVSLKPKPDINSKFLPGNRLEPKKSLVEVKARVNSFPKKSETNIKCNGVTRPEQKHPLKTKNPAIRRSLSSGHLQSKKGKAFDPRESYMKVSTSQSEENISTHLMCDVPPMFSPIMEENSVERNVIFKTPNAHDRRSMFRFTPHSARKSSLFQASTPAPVELLRLQERLNKWLKSRGKPLAMFHHLRCFGTDQIKKTSFSPQIVDEEDKENVEVVDEISESYENLKIDTPPESSKVEGKEECKEELSIKKDMPEEELVSVAKEAMVELQKLIEEDYPRAQCLGWLELIRDKYRKAVDEPEYWECRAAIEQSLGNVGNAVEFYKTAIIQGAEVTNVDKLLDQLLRKFSLLNISPNKAEKKVDGNKERIVREARTVFKSTIIQFAIQERKFKNKRQTNEQASDTQESKKLVATPVRRSTRLSRSAYVSTPGVKLCTSLREISIDQIDFENNKALC